MLEPGPKDSRLRTLSGPGLVLFVLPLILAIDNHNVTLIYVLVTGIRLTMSATWAPRFSPTAWSMS